MILLALAGLNLSIWLTLRLHTRKAQKQAELRVWYPFRQNPLLDRLLRRSMGDLNDPKRRWAAQRVKNVTRNFVNSEAFSIAVDGVMNQDSPAWDLGRQARKLVKYPKADAGILTPAPRENCTIH